MCKKELAVTFLSYYTYVTLINKDYYQEGKADMALPNVNNYVKTYNFKDILFENIYVFAKYNIFPLIESPLCVINI